MAIPSGTRLGPYEVGSLIGAGGMGEVYKARDTRLNRDVALKVLLDVFARDAQRMSRFEREAKLLASLNHPNIAAIYGLEESGPIRALVMELVEGPTLAERITAGPIPLDEALPIARQVADALEYAHDHSVVHRDLKPANIKVKADGTVKVLDFGLAKALTDEPTAADMSNSPTLSLNPTVVGTIMGTAAYMSPEQAKGKPVDRRADIWAFGVVVCEMLTGKQMYRGETAAETLASVMMKEPALDALPSNTSPAIRNLLRRCLEKDSRQRLRDIGEARIAIERAGSTSTEPVAAQSGRAPSRQALVFGLGALLLGAAIAGVAIWNLKPAPAPPLRPVTRYAITLPQGQQLAGLDAGPAVALSPDGTHLAYVGREGGTQQLYLRAMDSLEARPIPATEGAINPFFSPDSQSLGFFAGGKLKKVSVSGGAVQTLGDTALGRGASWSSQGMIAFAPTLSSGLQQVSDAGGSPQPLTRIEKGENSHRWPEFLPGGKALLFATAFTASNWNTAKVVVQSVGTGERRDLVQGGTHPRYALSGHLVYAQGGTLMVAPFDLQRLQVTGSAVPTVEGVLQSTFNGHVQYSFSNTGSLVYVGGGGQSGQGKLVWVSRNGAEQPLAAPARAYEFPRLSPDGRRVAASITDQDTQIWLYDLSREALTRLTFAGKANTNPVWTPDGKRIAFNSDREGVSNIFWQLADGSGGPERLTTSENTEVPRSWSPDAQLLTFLTANEASANPSANRGLDIWVLRMADRKAEPFLQTPFNESVPEFSPDGRWLAYTSDESGRSEIYVQPYPGPGGKWQVSTEGGTEPIWNSNGRELFYRSGEKMMAVEIATQPGFTAGKPRVLFEGQYAPSPATMPNYDVSPDGQRFLMLKPTEAEAGPKQINVVLNWFEELKRRVPTGK